MKNNKYAFTICCILFLSLMFLFAGISYSIFNYFGSGMTSNVIQTGRIVFSYSDADGGGNGINIENAVPISDEQGKILSGDGEYFDFTINASTVNTNLYYEIVVSGNDLSTLPEEYVKIYLTYFDGNKEMETPLTVINNDVVTYDKLNTTNNPSLFGKTIYYGTVSAGEVAYGQRFRLRMWVKIPENDDFDYATLYNKNFSLKVNVSASSVY